MSKDMDLTNVLPLSKAARRVRERENPDSGWTIISDEALDVLFPKTGEVGIDGDPGTEAYLKAIGL